MLQFYISSLLCDFTKSRSIYLQKMTKNYILKIVILGKIVRSRLK